MEAIVGPAVVIVDVLHPERSEFVGDTGGMCDQGDIVALTVTHGLHLYLKIADLSTALNGEYPDDSYHR